jgi:hypothetical protein
MQHNFFLLKNLLFECKLMTQFYVDELHNNMKHSEPLREDLFRDHEGLHNELRKILNGGNLTLISDLGSLKLYDKNQQFKKHKQWTHSNIIF